MPTTKIAFAGTDGRSFLAALEISRAKSELHPGDYRGLVIKGTAAMPAFAQKLGLPIDFISAKDNTIDSYADAIIGAFTGDAADIAMVMPESLLFNGLVDRIASAGFGDRVIGVNGKNSFIEADKIACKKLCLEAGIPVADDWAEADARDYGQVLGICLQYLHRHGGAVLKYPYSAAGKGSRIIMNAWEIREIYDGLMKDYEKDYISLKGKNSPWPLLIESRMTGVEISFTIFLDKNGHYRILPTSMDYPERFAGPPGINNPITGGMGAISPHPFESSELLDLARDTIARPLIEILKKNNMVRPCVLYPGCFVSFNAGFKPSAVRVCEINIRPGEPEFQPVIKRLRNPGALIKAMVDGNLDEVEPEVRENQISISMALVAGPGGPEGQKGYPWSYTKGEPVEIDYDYFAKKRIGLIPSAMDYSPKDNALLTDGSRIIYLIANAEIMPGQTKGEAAWILSNKLLYAFDNGKIRVVPRENITGNRLDLRRDIGSQFRIAENLTAK